MKLFLPTTVLLSVCFITSCQTKLENLQPIDAAKYRTIYQQKSDQARQLIFTGNDSILHVMHDSIDEISLTNSAVKTIYKTTGNSPLLKAELTGKQLLAVSFNRADLLEKDTWKTVASYSGDGIQKINLSKSGKLISIPGKIISTENNKQVKHYDPHYSVSASAFSFDDRYFIEAGNNFGAFVIEMKGGSNSAMLIPGSITGTQKIQFSDEEYFYIDEGSKISLKFGGEYVSNLKKIRASTGEVHGKYYNKRLITCWSTLKNRDGVFLTLTTGDLVVTDESLNEIYKFNTGFEIETCDIDDAGNLWLGSRNRGVFLFDLEKKNISHIIDMTSPVVHLAISDNSKYVGVISLHERTYLVEIYASTDFYE